MDKDQTVLEHKLAQYKERNVFQIKLGLTDIDGVIRGKYVGLEKFASLLSKQGGFVIVYLVGTLTISFMTRAVTQVGIPDFQTRPIV